MQADLEAVQRLLASRGADLDVDTAVLVGADGRLLSASRPEWVGRALDELPLLQEPNAIAMPCAPPWPRSGRCVEGDCSKPRARAPSSACFPSDRTRGDAASAAGRADLLLVVYNLHRDHTHAVARLRQRVAVQTLAALFMAIVMGVVFHLLVTRRIRRVLSAFRAFAAGDQTARIGDRTPDEIGDLCRGLEELMVHVARGVTELRQTGRLHRRNEERLRGTLASLDDIVLTVGADGCFEAFLQPRKVGELYVPPEHFVGRPIADIALPRDLKRFLGVAIDRLRTSDEVMRLEYTLELPAGRRWFNATISRRVDAGGAFAGITAAVRDISAQRQAESEQVRLQAKLEQASREWRRTFDAMETAIVILDEGLLACGG